MLLTIGDYPNKVRPRYLPKELVETKNRAGVDAGLTFNNHVEKQL